MPPKGRVYWVTKIFESGKTWMDEHPNLSSAKKSMSEAFTDSRVVGVIITKDRFGERS